jgi:hypothetical protein
LHVRAGGWVPGGPDWCSAQVHLHIADGHGKQGTLWTTCQDNGLLMLKFENGVWPFEDCSTPPGEQNSRLEECIRRWSNLQVGSARIGWLARGAAARPRRAKRRTSKEGRNPQGGTP